MKPSDIIRPVKTQPGETSPHLIRRSGETLDVLRILKTDCHRSKWHLSTGAARRTYYYCVISVERHGSTTVTDVNKQADPTGSVWRINGCAD